MSIILFYFYLVFLHNNNSISNLIYKYGFRH